jgi:ribonucleoside-triphosphate reductase
MMIRKRDGREVDFDETKITDAIFAAAKSVGGADRQMAMEITLDVLKYLKAHFKGIVTVEQVRRSREGFD